MLNKLKFNYPDVADRYVRQLELLREVQAPEDLVRNVIEKLPMDNVFGVHTVLIFILRDLEKVVKVAGDNSKGNFRIEHEMHNNVLFELLPLLDTDPDRVKYYPNYLKKWLKIKATFGEEIWQLVYSYLFADEG